VVVVLSLGNERDYLLLCSGLWTFTTPWQQHTLQPMAVEVHVGICAQLHPVATLQAVSTCGLDLLAAQLRAPGRPRFLCVLPAEPSGRHEEEQRLINVDGQLAAFLDCRQ
jgi:hypothetical protein